MNTKDTPEKSKPESEVWINLKAACCHLGISVPTGRRWINGGILKPKRTPTGAYRFKRSDLDDILG